MATFNTAFGALQTPQDVANRSTQPSGGIRIDRMVNQQAQPASGGIQVNRMMNQQMPSLPGQQQVQAQMQSQQQRQQQPAQQQTFAQMQQAGQARPAPQMPVPAPPPQFQGSQQAQQMRQRLQQSLESFAQAPTRFDTAAFQQIRAAQQGMLGREFTAQQQALNEEMARRGLSASSITAGRFGDLAGQQALAQAQIDAQLLQEAARTQAEDRANLLLQMSQLAELSGAQDLAQYQAQLAGQQQQFAQGIQQAGVTGQYGGAPTLAGQELQLRLAELTGQAGGAQTLAAQQFQEQQRQFDIQQRLQEQLGLGGLTLEQQRLAQQTADQAAERALRETMQTRDLTAQEQQQLRDIEARKQLQTEQITAEREESAAERAIRLQLQSGQITAEEAAQRRQIVSQQELQARELAQQAEQFAVETGLRQQEIDQRAAQIQEDQRLRGREISINEARQKAEDEVARANITGTLIVDGREVSTLAAERLGQEKLQVALQRAEQLSNSTGIVHTVDDAGNVVQKMANNQPVRTESALARLSQEDLARAELTGEFTNADGSTSSTIAAQQLDRELYNDRVMQALQQSEATGLMYKVDNNGNVVLDTDAQGNPVSTEQRRAQLEQERSVKFQEGLRKAEALSAQSGLSYTVDALGNVTADIDPETNKQRSTIEAQQLAQQKALAEAELTGTIQINGRSVDTMAMKRFGIDEINNKVQQAAQRSQVTGNVFYVDANGDVVQQLDSRGQPISNESALARLSQERLREAELKGFFVGPNDTIISTVAAKSLSNQELEALTRRAALMSQMEGKIYEVNDKGEVVATNRDTEEVRANQEREKQAKIQNALAEARALSEVSGLSWVIDGDGNVVKDIGSDGKQRTTEQARQFSADYALRYEQAQATFALTRMQLLAQLAQLLGYDTDADGSGTISWTLGGGSAGATYTGGPDDKI
jgi:hypothetical protein